MPPSAARSRIANAVLSSDCSPNVIVPRHSLETCRPLRPSLAWSIPARYLAGCALRAGGVLGQAGGGGGGAADPLVLPGLIELLVVAARLVDRGKLPGDLLSVGAAAARYLVGADIDPELRAGPLDPAVCPRMLEREPLRTQVVGVPHVDDRVLVRLGLRVRLVGDRVHRRRGRRRPAGHHPGSLEGVPGQRAEPDHAVASSSSLTASVRTTDPAGSPAWATARVNSVVAAAIASSRLPASTISCAPYLLVPMPVAIPPFTATASASSTTSSRVSTRSPSASIPTLH